MVNTPAAVAGDVTDDQRQIRLAVGLDAAVQPAGAESGRRGDAALDRACAGSTWTGSRHGRRTLACRFAVRVSTRCRSSSEHDARTGRSCGTAGSDCSRARSSPAPRCAARSRSRGARRTPDRARTRTDRVKPSRRARAARSSTMRTPRPSVARFGLTTSERTSATRR